MLLSIAMKYIILLFVFLLYIMKNKVYIWNNVLCDYTRGMAVAIASNKKEAIKLLLKEFDNFKAAYCDKKNWHNGMFLRWDDFKSHIGTNSFRYEYLRDDFENDLNNSECYIYDTNIPFAIFQGGGS